MSISISRFDPLKLRMAKEELVGAGYLVDTKYDAARPMGNVAASNLSFFVECILVGLWPRVSHLVSARVDWIDCALASGESCGESTAFHHAWLLKCKALYLWLHTGQVHADVWALALDSHEAAMFEPGCYLPKHIASLGLDDFMGFSLLAGKPERGVQMYHRLRGQEATARSGVFSRPQQWAYWYCRQTLQPPVDRPSLLKAGRRLLRTNLDDTWIGRGQAHRAGMWLLLVYQLHDGPLSPTEVILKAYDDMPGVTKPAQLD